MCFYNSWYNVIWLINTRAIRGLQNRLQKRRNKNKSEKTYMMLNAAGSAVLATRLLFAGLTIVVTDPQPPTWNAGDVAISQSTLAGIRKNAPHVGR